MTITTFAIGAAVTPTVVKTYVSHYANRKPRHQKPTAHISYDEGLHLVRSFLEYASHKTVEDLQAFTAQWVPHPTWVRTENIKIPVEHISKAADTIIDQLGHDGLNQVGGSKWWQWRRKGSELKAEWIEMKSDYSERKSTNAKSRRVMLYVHGGAYFFGSVDEHRYQLQRHARKLKARVLAPRYRLAPQFPFPCGLQDCLAVYLYLLTLHDPSEIIIAGDSAGGGMAVTILCILRDRGIPLPAGAILISPWVDLTHSFPSLVGGNDFDYVPPHGFQQRPSPSWPPPNEDDLAAIAKGTVSKVAGDTLPKKSTPKECKTAESNAVQGFEVLNSNGNEDEMARNNPNNPAGPDDSNPRGGDTIPGPSRQLSIEMDGKLVVLKDQIQMYTTNQLLSHPLVSPVLQPSLGGLPPLLILTGGGEILRDEQIYLAHKAAHPTRYPLGDVYRSKYDPEDALLNKYKPTPVQLQVWEDLCHVAPTLSFTRPAKYMYRSVAQFGAWALARAQNTAIEIVDDDNISIISSRSGSDAGTNESTDSLTKQKRKQLSTPGSIGKAGDPLPMFRNHMIRQRVDRHGNVYPLAPAHELAATQMHANDVGVIKPGPVKKWMEAKRQWDTKYAHTKRSIQKQRMKEMVTGGSHSFGGGEYPPPSALAGRRAGKEEEEKKKRKSYGLALWSGWGSKHDEETIKREEEAVSQQPSNQSEAPAKNGISIVEVPDDTAQSTSDNTIRRLSTGKKQAAEERSRSRRRTISVTNQGQTEGQEMPAMFTPILKTDAASPAASSSRATTPPMSAGRDGSHLSPGYMPKFKAGPLLRNELRDPSDAASTRTGYSNVMSDNASTMAVFGAAGISRETGPTDPDGSAVDKKQQEMGDESSLMSDAASPIRDRHGPADGYDTPVSRRSMERLQSHQLHPDGDADGRSITSGSGIHLQPGDLSGTPRLQAFRSPSTTAIVKQEGTVGIVPGGEADQSLKQKAKENQPPLTNGGTHAEPEPEPEPVSIPVLDRPGMYERKDSEFQTAMEKL